MNLIVTRESRYLHINNQITALKHTEIRWENKTGFPLLWYQIYKALLKKKNLAQFKVNN